jgi:hypothetical protein
MTYIGTVRGGVVVLDGTAVPAEGTVVRVEEVSASDDRPAWTEVFKDLIGAAEGLPEDLAENHDHYLYGAPRK